MTYIKNQIHDALFRFRADEIINNRYDGMNATQLVCDPFMKISVSDFWGCNCDVNCWLPDTSNSMMNLILPLPLSTRIVSFQTEAIEGRRYS